jgi:hypothetical protein
LGVHGSHSLTQFLPIEFGFDRKKQRDFNPQITPIFADKSGANMCNLRMIVFMAGQEGLAAEAP